MLQMCYLIRNVIKLEAGIELLLTFTKLAGYGYILKAVIEANSGSACCEMV